MLKKTTIAILLSTAGLIGCSKMFHDEPSDSVKVIVTAKDTDERMTEREPIAFGSMHPRPISPSQGLAARSPKRARIPFQN
jgi:hypothetical protein